MSYSYNNYRPNRMVKDDVPAGLLLAFMLIIVGGSLAVLGLIYLEQVEHILEILEQMGSNSINYDHLKDIESQDI